MRQFKIKSNDGPVWINENSRGAIKIEDKDKIDNNYEDSEYLKGKWEPLFNEIQNNTKAMLIEPMETPVTEKEHDYRIEESLNRDNLTVYFQIIDVKFNKFATTQRFYTLEAAKEAVKLLRKYEERVFHYVDDEE